MANASKVEVSRKDLSEAVNLLLDVAGWYESPNVKRSGRVQVEMVVTCAKLRRMNAVARRICLDQGWEMGA